MSHQLLQDNAREHLLLHFTNHSAAYADDRELLVLERGEGPYVFDTKGNRYVDALSSLFCAQIGYSYGEEMTSVIAAQMQALPFNTNWATAHPAAIELADALADRMPGHLNHVFFTNGGSESVESAWKIAREHFTAIGEPQRTKAIARQIAYHGVTLGALAFTGVPGFKEIFGPPPVDVTHVSTTNMFRAPDAGDPEAMTRRLLAEMRETVDRLGPENVAVIIAEPVQNAGGCLVAPPGYWQGLREIADEIGALLISDEVICGFGRLGEWLGVEREGLFQNVHALEGHLEAKMAELRSLPIVGDTRGRGFFWAAEMVGDADNRQFTKEERDRLLRGFLPKRLLEAGIIARCDDRGDSVLQIAPPLIADAALLDDIVDRLAAVLADAGAYMGVGV
jgi:adenosylmethionine-8-amino-7-oxononanoate aminotransferase